MDVVKQVLSNVPWEEGKIIREIQTTTTKRKEHLMPSHLTTSPPLCNNRHSTLSPHRLCRSETPLQMGQWHTIKVSRTARLAVLKVSN